jgi:hypothetical protein
MTEKKILLDKIELCQTILKFVGLLFLNIKKVFFLIFFFCFLTKLISFYFPHIEYGKVLVFSYKTEIKYSLLEIFYDFIWHKNINWAIKTNSSVRATTAVATVERNLSRHYLSRLMTENWHFFG